MRARVHYLRTRARFAFPAVRPALQTTLITNDLRPAPRAYHARDTHVRTYMHTHVHTRVHTRARTRRACAGGRVRAGAIRAGACVCARVYTRLDAYAYACAPVHVYMRLRPLRGRRARRRRAGGRDSARGRSASSQLRLRPPAAVSGNTQPSTMTGTIQARAL